MEQDPSPGQSDELRGLAVLVLAGAVALGVLLVASAFGHERERGAQRDDPAHGDPIVGVLAPWTGASTPSEATRTAGAQPAFVIGAPASGPREDDPQMRAFERSYATADDAGVRQPFSIAYHRGTLVSASGTSVHPGARCEVRVLPVQSYDFNCLVRVTCDDVVIYPDDALRAGYAPCRIEGSEAVTAIDESSTDGDREIDLDVRSRSVLVEEHVGDREVLSAHVVLES